MPADFTAAFEAQLIGLLVPESAPTAADVKTSLRIDGNIEYEGEPDQSTALYLNVSVSGFDEAGNRLWSYDREYEGSAAPMALLADMAKAQQPDTDRSKAPMTDTTPDHLTVTRTDRGFSHLPALLDTYGGQVEVYESSAASGPHIWLNAQSPANYNDPAGAKTQAMLHLPVEDAVKLAEQILLLARGHYQGPTDCDQCTGTVTEHEPHCARGR